MKAVLYLRTGREKSPLLRHPWVFSQAVEKVHGAPEPGDVVCVKSAGGEFLAWGFWNPRSQIALRLLEWTQEREINREWWRERLAQAIARRASLLANPSLTACRLVYSEADLLPGLIVDKYGEYLVLQALSIGIERLKPMLAELLMELTSAKGIYERSDVEVRKLEGLDPTAGPLLGDVPPRVEILEHGHRFLVDIAAGQ
ncbi:MAG: class I SAM-dependent rRNA methyltransferase, partial [candidate division WOR-3 bacterium]